MQLTDCHLQAAPEDRLLGVDTAATFTAVLEQALAEATPDLLLLTGDLAHSPTLATYERLQALVRDRYAGPVRVLPGNHDALDPLRSVFTEVPGDGSPQVLSWGPRTLVLVDSHGDDQPEAQLSDPQRAQLTAAVAASAEPVILVLHHPLLPIDAPWLDKDCVPGGEGLIRALAAAGPLESVLFGHVHQPVAQRLAGVALFGTPSTCFQFAPRSERFGITREQPGYRWVRVDAAGGELSTTLRRLNAPQIRVESKFVVPGA